MAKIKDWFAKRFWSLKFRMILLFFLFLFLVISGLIGIFFRQMHANYHDFSKSMIHSTAKIIYQSIFDGMMNNNKQQIQRNLELLSLEPTIKQIRIYRPSGTILFSSNQEEKNGNVYELDGHATIPVTGADSLFKELDDIYFYQYPIVIHKECLQCHVNEENKTKAFMNVYAGYPMSEKLYSSVEKYTILGVVLLIFTMWFLMSWLYKRQIESRLQLINSGFNQLAMGNLNVHITMPGQHELADMAEQFNQTVKKLKASREKEEQYYLERLSQADRLVTMGEVVTEIAHAVNNPAGIVLSRIEYIRDKLASTQTNQLIVNDLDAIIRQVELIGKVTRNIMCYARRLPGGFTEVNLNEIIHNSIDILEPKIRKNKIDVTVDLPESASIVWGNSVQLEQVFCNLLNNSLDVLPPETGKISIGLQEIQHDTNHHFQVIFKDNGPGISESIREHVFYPFFTTKPQEQGTGLGLFIARNIIKNHGGKIKLEQNSLSGACFIINLNKYR